MAVASHQHVASDPGAGSGSAAALGEVWPDVGSRLLRLLRSRGVDLATSEDIVQETAARVLERGVPHADSEDLFRWAAVVGWRLAVDDHRKRSRLAPDGPPEYGSPVDVQREVESRLRLAELGTHLARLSPTDRQALLAGLEAAGTLGSRREAIKHSVRLHRARNRLRQRLGDWGPAAIGQWLRGRLTVRRPSRQLVTVGSAVSIVGAIVVGMPGGLWTGHGGAAGSRLARGPAALALGIIRGERPRDDGGVRGQAQRAVAAGTGAPSGRSAARALIPQASARVAGVPSPVTPVSIGVRPKRPSDHLFCAHVLGGTNHCLDAPPLPYPRLP